MAHDKQIAIKEINMKERKEVKIRCNLSIKHIYSDVLTALINPKQGIKPNRTSVSISVSILVSILYEATISINDFVISALLSGPLHEMNFQCLCVVL